MGDIRGNLEKAKGGKHATQAVPLPPASLYQYLDKEIEKLTDTLHAFYLTSSYDAGWRKHCLEAKLEGLIKARMLVRRAEKRLTQRLAETGAKSE